jgi:hypothetical protein
MNKKSHRYIILTPKYCRKDQRICDGRVRGARDLIFQSLCGPVEIKKPLTWNAYCPSSSLKGSILFQESPSRGRPEFDGFYLFFRVELEAAKLRWAGGGAQRPVWLFNEPKKTGARSARARTRGQNPLV